MNIFDEIYSMPEFKENNFEKMAVLSGRDYFGNPFHVPLPFSNTLFVGTTRSGKSVQIAKMMSQTMQDKNSIHIVFDPKGEFCKKFYREGTDYVVSLFDQPHVKQNVKWNIMKDIVLSDHPETEIREIAAAIFEESIQQNNSNKFFPESARAVTAASWLMMHRRYKNSLLPNNKCLIGKTKEISYEILKKEAKSETNKDLRGDIELLSPKSPKTAASIKSEQINTLTQLFNPEGNFCTAGDFSFREFMRNGQGRRIFLVYDFATSYTCRQIFGIIINIMMKESLAIKENSDFKTFYYFDELPILPDNIFNLPDTVNFAQSNNVFLIFGIQSVSQLYDVFGEYKSNSLLSGFNTSIIMRANDALSIDSLSQRSGKFQKTTVSMGATRNDIHSGTETCFKIPPEAMAQLDTGEAIVSMRGKNDPFYIHFDR